VDTKRFPLAPATRNSTPKILFASRLLREKGLYELVEALRKLRAAGVAFEFRCAGTADAGNPSAIPAEILAEWSKEGIVNLLGHVDKIENEIAAADIVLLPSWREGLPKILIEAACAGKALLAADVPGCREVIDHEKNGWLTEVKNASSLEQGLHALLLDEKLRERLGLAAREKALAEFDQEIIHKKTISIYEDLLSQA
jgi:glycosyltransferase involved in cell wall biosynthesis